jgi:hypothetical protein
MQGRFHPGLHPLSMFSQVGNAGKWESAFPHPCARIVIDPTTGSLQKASHVAAR